MVLRLNVQNSMHAAAQEIHAEAKATADFAKAAALEATDVAQSTSVEAGAMLQKAANAAVIESKELHDGLSTAVSGASNVYNSDAGMAVRNGAAKVGSAVVSATMDDMRASAESGASSVSQIVADAASAASTAASKVRDAAKEAGLGGQGSAGY